MNLQHETTYLKTLQRLGDRSRDDALGNNIENATTYKLLIFIKWELCMYFNVNFKESIPQKVRRIGVLTLSLLLCLLITCQMNKSWGASGATAKPNPCLFTVLFRSVPSKRSFFSGKSRSARYGGNELSLRMCRFLINVYNKPLHSLILSNKTRSNLPIL